MCGPVPDNRVMISMGRIWMLVLFRSSADSYIQSWELHMVHDTEVADEDGS